MMIEGAGVVRSAASLDAARRALEAMAAGIGDGAPADGGRGELVNLVTAARAVLSSASLRCETRGAHARSDHPQTSAGWRRRIVHTGRGAVVLTGTPIPDPGHRSRPDPGPAGR
jgi:L-aspartate oxidase